MTPSALVAGRVTDLVRAAYHPDFHRRSRSFTRSTGRWLRSGRGLSPPVRSCTDPGARLVEVWHAASDVVRVIYGTPVCRSRYRERSSRPAGHRRPGDLEDAT